jgi:hypothetical protein
MNSENKNELETNVITNGINQVSLKKECEDTGKNWKRNCPKCNKILFYTSRFGLNRAIKINGICYKCAYIKRDIVPWNKGIKSGLVLTPEQKERHRNSQKARYNPYRYCYTMLKNQAKYRKLECLLTFDEFLEFTKINKCEYCGDNILWEEHITNISNRGGYNLDRKDNKLGYTKQNCVVCCKNCNAMKSDKISYDLMIRLGDVMKEYRKEKEVYEK